MIDRMIFSQFRKHRQECPWQEKSQKRIFDITKPDCFSHFAPLYLIYDFIMSISRKYLTVGKRVLQ